VGLKKAQHYDDFNELDKSTLPAVSKTILAGQEYHKNG
jgi:hypothetical protein